MKKDFNGKLVIGLFIAAIIVGAVVYFQLTGKLGFIPTDLCPKKDGQILCGICNQDKMFSKSPYAGQCSYCPNGTICSGDPCGEVKCNPSTSYLPKINIVNISYVNKQGKTFTAIGAFPGYVSIYTEGISNNDATNAFLKEGGKVYYSDLDIGSYLISVEKGREAEFLNKILKNKWAIEGNPESGMTRGTIAEYDFFNYPPYFAKQTEWNCGRDHGNIVEKIAQRYFEVETHDLPPEMERRNSAEYRKKFIKEVGQRMIEAGNNCTNVVFSFSLQSGESGYEPSYDKTGCTLEYCENIKEGQRIFYRDFLKKLNKTIAKDPSAGNRVIIVIIAGNAGVDMDDVLRDMEKEYPIAFKQMVVVGSNEFENKSDITLKFNHLSNNTLEPGQTRPRMVYALGVNKSVFSGEKEMIQCEGTSFAAPEVASVIDYIWRRTPALSANQVLDGFYTTLIEKGKNGILPNIQKGMEVYTHPSFINAIVERNKLVKTDEMLNLTGFWTGTYTSHRVSEEGWTCITETNDPIKVCVKQQCRNITGQIVFPRGLNGKTTSPEKGAFCPPTPSPGGLDNEGYGGSFTGILSGNNTINLTKFNIMGASFISNPYFASENIFSNASANNDTMEFNFGSSGHSGNTLGDTMTGNFKVSKISDICK